MSVPTTIFIDTCILDEQNYNFSSKAISAFLEAVKGPKMVLLLPDPTRREIERHIEKRSQEAVKMLEEAEPVWDYWQGWNSIDDMDSFLNRLESEIERPVSMVGIGPNRSDIVIR